MPKQRAKKAVAPKKLPIEYWSHSSLISFLRNPLAWYKRYVLRIYDTPKTPAGVVGVAGHVALQHFYSGASKEVAMRLGLEHLQNVPDFEINFGVAKTRKAQKAKRAAMEREYAQAVGFYLARAPRHRVLGVEVKGVAAVPGLPLPVKAVSDLVVESKGNPGCVDVVDHKFVDAFTPKGSLKGTFALQAIFNYYTVSELFGKPVKRFIVYECKKTRNANGRAQLRKCVMEYAEAGDTFELFRRLIADATAEIARERAYLPNPSDMFEGEDSLLAYRLGLIDESREERLPRESRA